MSGNLGRTRLTCRTRAGRQMQEFDRLPGPLRRWLAQAALPWSPRSARRIYSKELRRMGAPEPALARLSRTEAAMLARAQLEGPQPGAGAG